MTLALATKRTRSSAGRGLGAGEQYYRDWRTWTLNNYHPRIIKFGPLYTAIAVGTVPMPAIGTVPVGPGIPLNIPMPGGSFSPDERAAYERQMMAPAIAATEAASASAAASATRSAAKTGTIALAIAAAAVLFLWRKKK